MQKILVIADDFTGAAEIAGIGLRYGLAAAILREGSAGSPQAHPLTIVDTDSRLLPPEQAAARVQAALRAHHAPDDTLLFKKIDSVMRGPVLAEVQAALAATGRSTAIVIPANPSRNRIIRGGHYHVAGIPLHQTEFAADPHHPALTSHVVERIGGAGLAHARDATEPLHAGIIIGNAASSEDMRSWAARVTTDCFPVGGADFFTALLGHAGYLPLARSPEATPANVARLLVCGTTSITAHAALDRAAAAGTPILNMPQTVYASASPTQTDLNPWQRDILNALHQRGRAIVAVRHPLDPARSQQIVETLTAAVAAILPPLNAPCEIFAEGGSTASHLASRMGWREFSASRELATGVVRLAIANEAARWLTIKPGSYPWPPEVWASLAH